MMKYPIGIQNFSTLREGGFVYIDKTQYIRRLVERGKYYFLSRPRRFGKSLLMSTIEAFYSGRHELFEGLAIETFARDRATHPVLHLSLNKPTIGSLDDLKDRLNSFLREYSEVYGNSEASDSPSLRFGGLIKSAHLRTGEKVVILIDEYDKPLLDAIDNPELQDSLQGLLKGFYSNLKDMDEHIEFAMLTGVTRFGKLSVFSDLNNLDDISLDKEYDAICGITTDELKAYFDESVGALAAEMNITKEEAFITLKQNYDGYHFAPGGRDIYNPFSILSALSKRIIGDYWFETGTPTFLIKMVKAGQLQLSELNHYEVALSEINNMGFANGNVVAILYQSGYLTIRGVDNEFGAVILDYPNREVERGFLRQLLLLYTTVQPSSGSFTISRFVKDVRAGRVEDFMTRLQGLFAGYQCDQMDLGNLELHYRNVIYLVMKLMGFYTRAEMQTASGRIDLMVETSDYLYLFEFKLDSDAQTALEQINSREYLLPFRADGRKIIKIGASFSGRTRSIDGWVVEGGEHF